MSNSLLNSGISGLNAAQNQLRVISNNMNNAYTAGYNRQQILCRQANGTHTGQGFMGNGVTVGKVERIFNGFAVSQLRHAAAEGGTTAAYFNRLSKIDKLFADEEGDLAHQMKGIFDSMSKLSSDAGNIANRKNVLNALDALVNRFNKIDQGLKEQIFSTNVEIADTVEKINNYTKQIAELNEKIANLSGGSGGDQPNALLDQRDQLVNELNSLVGVTVTEQNGQYNISMANGLSLVQGGSVTSLSVEPSTQDSSLNSVIYTHPSGEKQELGQGFITSGQLNGLLKFRDGPLVEARNQLGLLALNIAQRFNEVHRKGVDLNGDPGEPLFSYADPSYVANTDNTGNASLKISYGDVRQVQASDYKVEFNGRNWVVTRLSDNTPVKTEMKEGKLTFDGLSIEVSGQPEQGDVFTIKPVADVPGSLKSLITDANKLAAGLDDDKKGAGDNRNLKELMKIQDEKLVGGKSTLNQAYAGLVSYVGAETNSAKVSAETNQNILKNAIEENQSISGVNIDEEFISLQVYLQYYQASAQIIQTANTLFDTILGVVK